MRASAITALLLAGLLGLAGLTAAQNNTTEEDPFAEHEDPFADEEDPFADYEAQANDTVAATESLAPEDEEGSESGDGTNDTSPGDGEQTKDSPGPGLVLVGAAGLAGARLARD